MFPSNGSMIRRLASLPRVLPGPVPRLPRYYQGAMTSCRPSRRTSFPSLGGTTAFTRSFRSRGGRVRRRRAWSWSPGISGREFVRGDDRISQVPGEPPLCSCPALRPRQDRRIRPLRCRSVAPAMRTAKAPDDEVFRGSITRLSDWLSTLRRAGCPATTQDSLPAAGQALPDGLYPQGSIERFQMCFLHLILLSQASWRNHIHPRGNLELECQQHDGATGCRRQGPRIRMTTRQELPPGCQT